MCHDRCSGASSQLRSLVSSSRKRGSSQPVGLHAGISRHDGIKPTDDSNGDSSVSQARMQQKQQRVTSHPHDQRAYPSPRDRTDAPVTVTSCGSHPASAGSFLPSLYVSSSLRASASPSRVPSRVLLAAAELGDISRALALSNKASR